MRMITLAASLVAAVAIAVAADAATTPLTAYAGKYPSFDKVGGVTFLAQPVVIAGVKKAVADKTVQGWVLGTDNTETPVFVTAGRVYAHACEAHNCGDHDWTVIVDAASGATDVCYHDASAMPADQSRWYLAAGASQTRAGDCPQQ